MTKSEEKIRVYLIARISEDAHLWNKKICDNLKHPIEVFMPHHHNPWNKKHELFSKNVFDTDLDAMKKSHMGLLLPEFGRDCSFEVGWYANSKKPVIVFVDTQKEWLRDWMVKGGLDIVITNNPSTHRVLKKDPILKHKKIILIDNLSKLNSELKEIYKEVCGEKNC